MKNRFWLLLLLYPITSTAQVRKPPEGFWDIRFGTRKDSVKKMLLKRNITPLLMEDGSWYCRIQKFGGYKANRLFLKFNNGRFSCGFVSFLSEDNSPMYETYNQIKYSIETKYGSANIVERKVLYPSRASQEEISTEMKTGQAKVSDEWDWEDSSQRPILRYKVLLTVSNGSLALMYIAPAFLTTIDGEIEKQKREF